MIDKMNGVVNCEPQQHRHDRYGHHVEWNIGITHDSADDIGH